MKIILNNEPIDVVINYKNIKNIYFRIENNNLIISCSSYYKEKQLITLIESNRKSLEKMYYKYQKQMSNNLNFSFLGKKYTVIYDNSINEPIIEDEYIIFKDEKMKDKFINNQTINIFSKRLEEISKDFDYLPLYKLKIRKMKTRWGVCNRSNNTITLNSELLKKDITLLDYVIVHELCHFKEANHSVKFWLEVSKHYPNYKEARKRLRSE